MTQSDKEIEEALGENRHYVRIYHAQETDDQVHTLCGISLSTSAHIGYWRDHRKPMCSRCSDLEGLGQPYDT